MRVREAVVITLDEDQLAYAEKIARLRRDTARQRSDAHGCTASMAADGYGEDRAGACSEAAFHIWLWPGRPLKLSVGTYRTEPDFPDTEVRSAGFAAARLIHRTADREDYAYVLVVPFGSTGSKWRLAGWVRGHEARQARWWYEDNGREPAWFVPQGALHEMGLLRG